MKKIHFCCYETTLLFLMLTFFITCFGTHSLQAQDIEWRTSLWPLDYIAMSEGQAVEYTTEKFGNSVAVGDVNGDSYDDVIVCSENWVRIYEGPLPAQDGLTWAKPMLEIGEVSSYYAFRDIAVADVNNDGLMDIVIGSHYSATPHDGWIYVFHGRADWTTSENPIQLDYYDDADWKTGSPNNSPPQNGGGKFGRSVACAGDQNGDGIDDIIVGAPEDGLSHSSQGKVFIYYGSSSGLPSSGSPSRTLTASDYTSYETWGLNYPLRTQHLGWDVDRGGHSGTTDNLVIGCPSTDVNIDKNSIYYDNENNIGLAVTRTLTPKFLPGNQGETYTDYKYFGYSVGYAGDVNGDGLPEIITCALNRYTTLEPKIFLFLGDDQYGYPLEFSYSWSVEGIPYKYLTSNSFKYVHTPVGSAGDVNGDGYGDIYIGDQTYNPDDTQGQDGRVHIWFGGAPSTNDPTGLGQNQTPETADVILDPSSLYSFTQNSSVSFGYSVAAGDIDGDGKDDIVVGDPYCFHPDAGDDPGVQTGAVHIFVTGTALNPPEDCTALSGYHKAVPLAWQPPQGSGSETVTGYNIYRSTSQQSGYTKIVSNRNRQYYRDTNLTNGQTYYYKITAVNNTTESDYSKTVQATPVQNGYQVTLDLPESAPTIDGVLNSGEWNSSGSCDITYPGKSGTVTMYAMNDENYLYLAVDDPTDTNLDNSDGIGLFFDENVNRAWPSSADGTEGMMRIYYNNEQITASFSGFYGIWPNESGQNWSAASGVDA
ncbi:MAG: FG-GAP-like repeat-containing protein, partial [bacterium]